jgi:anti-sigma B factor antagonist
MAMESESNSGARVTERGALTIRLSADAEPNLVQLFGEMDASNVQSVEAELQRLEGSDARVVLDLSGLNFIDSTGVAFLVKATRRSRSRGDGLGLLHGGEHVKRVLSICGLEDELPYLD